MFNSKHFIEKISTEFGGLTDPNTGKTKFRCKISIIYPLGVDKTHFLRSQKTFGEKSSFNENGNVWKYNENHTELVATVKSIIDDFIADLADYEQHTIAVEAEKTRASAIVSALSALKLVSQSQDTIAAIAAQVSIDERKNTLSIVRERLSKLTYGKSALAAISDL
jgi:hypothetical protein